VAGSIRDERRRVEAALAAALLAAGGAAAAYGCSDPTGASPVAVDDAAPEHDATRVQQFEGGEPVDAGGDCAQERRFGCGTQVDSDAMFYDPATDADICPIFLPCGLPTGTLLSGCALVANTEGQPIGCWVAPDGGCEDGAVRPGTCGQLSVLCDCSVLGGGGRRTGRRVRRAATVASLGDYFREMAREEAASVRAFRRLCSELVLHRAPASLVAETVHSAHDEIRHARVMRRLAIRFGARVVRRAPRARPAPACRGLLPVARENLIEGCVRETFGALVLRWQASHAQAPGVARALVHVARDEARHAALAWAVDRFCRRRLGTRFARRLDEEKRAALRQLDRALVVAAPQWLVRGAGLPTPAQARALLAEMTHALEHAAA